MTKESPPSSKTNITTLTQAIGSLIDSLLSNTQSYELALPPIDRVMGGVRGGDMCVVAARTGMGKTAVALQAALENAKHHNVCFISLEMTPEQLARRALQRLTAINPDDWKENHAEIMKTAAALIGGAGGRIHIAETNREIHSVLMAMLEAREKRGCSLFFVDYLQRIRGRGIDRYQQITHVSEELKSFAVKHKLPLVVLAQLSRQVEGRSNGHPRMSDLKESGQIEQDADQIILIWRPSEYDNKANEADLNIVMPKSRHTETISREVTMYFDRARQTIGQRASEWQESDARRDLSGRYNPVFDAYNRGEKF